MLPKVIFGICEILPRVDVRAAYSLYYYRPFLLWAVITGLFVKFAYVRFFTRLGWSRCAIVDVTMNAASSLLNLIALPVAWWVWGLPRIALNRIFGTDYSDPVNWIAMLLVMALISATSDALVLHFVFSQRLGQKWFWLLYVVNTMCVAAAACGMYFFLVAHPPTAQLILLRNQVRPSHPIQRFGDEMLAVAWSPRRYDGGAGQETLALRVGTQLPAIDSFQLRDLVH